MKTSVYIIVDKNGFVNARKTQYTLKQGQSIFKINFDVTDLLFKQLIPEATIKISDEDVQDKVITELEFELKRLKAEE